MRSFNVASFVNVLHRKKSLALNLWITRILTTFQVSLKRFLRIYPKQSDTFET